MKRIIIGITILFLLMGIVVATDINDLKCPDGWENVNHKGNYRELGDTPNGPGSGRNLMTMEFTSANCDEFLTNDTSENYFVYKNSDNTFTFNDKMMNHDEGCFEVVEIDGKQYFLIFSSNTDKSYNGKPSISDIMMEFNKLNNLSPIEV